MKQQGLFEAPPQSTRIGAVDGWARRTDRWPFMGVDEAGRGPLAGPVVAAAVVLPNGRLPRALSGLDDSKKLDEGERRRLASAVARTAVAVGVGWGSPALIDEINILEATRAAMRQAVATASRRLGSGPRALLVDGNLILPGYPDEQWALVKGDGRSYAIAAASVIAKVARDRLMVLADARWPVYGFKQHKGYGTQAHRRALVAHGPCPIHRGSFKWTAP
jgi:ribonuclease HII